MAVGCAGAALVAAGCGLTNASSKTTTVTQTVTRTVTHTVTTTAPSSASNQCRASDLTGTFEVLPGSAGAGNIVYTLKVTNASQGACIVSGFPTVDFLDANGAVMPSKMSVGARHVAIVTLQPGDSARSQVRFSPDVDPCDPGTATTLRLSLPGDNSTVNVKIDPATRLCGGGSLQPTQFTGAD